MSDLAERLEHWARYADRTEVQDRYRQAAARIRELEAEVAYCKILESVASSLGYSSAANALHRLGVLDRAAAPHDPLTLIEAALKLPVDADGKPIAPGAIVRYIHSPPRPRHGDNERHVFGVFERDVQVAFGDRLVAKHCRLAAESARAGKGGE